LAATWFLLNVLYQKDLVEYGTSPRYGWLTGNGKKMMEFLRDYNADRLHELVNVDSDHVFCYTDYCNHTDLAGEGCKANPFWS